MKPSLKESWKSPPVEFAIEFKRWNHLNASLDKDILSPLVKGEETRHPAFKEEARSEVVNSARSGAQ